jgi:hypothetical protein
MSELLTHRVRSPSKLQIPTIADRASSAVFFQDQSKRKETRMILFYVCVNCGTNFTDPKVADS